MATSVFRLDVLTSKFDLSMIFTATILPVFLSFAFLTIEKVPLFKNNK